MTFRETKLVLFAADLAGYTRATANVDALSVAALLDDWYGRCAAVVRERGGRIVKFMGDGCLAVFPENGCLDAIYAAGELRLATDDLRSTHGVRVDLGGNVHLAVVAEGDFGPAEDRRYDVVGSGVNHVFLMGGGAGIRISEPVYRQLPNDRRRDWHRHRPPATYTLSRRT